MGKIPHPWDMGRQGEQFEEFFSLFLHIFLDKGVILPYLEFSDRDKCVCTA